MLPQDESQTLTGGTDVRYSRLPGAAFRSRRALPRTLRKAVPDANTARFVNEPGGDMMAAMAGTLHALVEKWARAALDRNWASGWDHGAIYPREMVFFLAICEANGVSHIVESGRWNGYSTEFIGEYARERKGRADSVDVEAEKDRSDRCRQRLAGNPYLSLIRGDGRHLLGPLLLSSPTVPAAVLIDGPKDWTAVSLLLACARFEGVRVLAMHNLTPGGPVRERFRRLAPGPHFYEDLGADFGPHWRELERAEREVATTRGAARSLDVSSLGILQISGVSRRRLLWTVSPKFGWGQPLRFYLGWRLLSACQ